MTQNLTVTEVAIILAVPTQTPTLINAEFLQYSGIVPSEWELVAEPIYNERVAQLSFDSGLTITVQPDRILLATDYATTAGAEIGETVARYVSTMKMADYQGLGINIRCHTSYSDPETARKFINSHLLGAGEWQQFGVEPLRARLDLQYVLADGRALQLNVSEASLQSEEREPEPVIVFGANFIQSVAMLPREERAEVVAKAARNWQQDLTQLQGLIGDKFLQERGQQLVVPVVVSLNS
jgi:hypothetical protein